MDGKRRGRGDWRDGGYNLACGLRLLSLSLLALRQGQDQGLEHRPEATHPGPASQ